MLQHEIDEFCQRLNHDGTSVFIVVVAPVSIQQGSLHPDSQRPGYIGERLVTDMERVFRADAEWFERSKKTSVGQVSRSRQVPK